MWAGSVTFGVIGSSFFGNVSNCWMNSYGKFGGDMRRRFFAICEKPEGGGADNRPPGRARVKVMGQPLTFVVRSMTQKRSKYDVSDNFVSEQARTAVDRGAFNAPLPNIRDSSKTHGGIDVKPVRPSHTTIWHHLWILFWNPTENFIPYTNHIWVSGRGFVTSKIWPMTSSRWHGIIHEHYTL